MSGAKDAPSNLTLGDFKQGRFLSKNALVCLGRDPIFFELCKKKQNVPSKRQNSLPSKNLSFSTLLSHGRFKNARKDVFVALESERW